MNQEQLFGHKIRHALHQSTDELDTGIAARLHAARTAALVHQRQPVTLLSFAGLGHATTEFFRSTLAPSMLAFALVIGATGALYVDNIMQMDDVDEIDSALLSDELPINAYLDDGFQVWVDSSLSASD